MAEVTVRATRRMGEMLREAVKPGNPQLSHDVTIRPKLAELGIERTDSHRCQLVAWMPF